MRTPSENRRVLLFCLALAAVTLISFCRVFGNGFVNYDDYTYVTENTHVISGLCLKNLVWAFNIGYASNWHPLTWVSHMLDCAIFGTNPIGHHATNLLIHTASVILLFLLLTRMTKSPAKSAFVAALFAVHPLHVESVAWIAERKDVLAGLFWILTTGAYVLYVERPSARRYASVVILFVLGLMSKPMLVTLPIALLLLDYWPLGRFEQAKTKKKRAWVGWKLILEKMPLFALSAASCAITLVAQSRGHAVASLEMIAFKPRVENAILSYAAYIGKAVWPAKLAAFYPPAAYTPLGYTPLWKLSGAILVLIAISAATFAARRRAPYLLVGWLWYLVTLVPVIGIVQVGEQAMADRYTYLPLIGIFIAITWGASRRMGVWECGSMGGSPARPLAPSPTRPHPHTPKLPYSHTSAALAVIIVLAVCSWIQTGYWKSTMTLFDHALRATGESAYAYANVGFAYADVGNLARAEKYMKKSLDLDPSLPYTHYDYANVLYKLKRDEDAVREYREALRLKPELAQAHRDLAIALYETGRYAEAWDEVHQCRRSGVELLPEFVRALSQEMPDPSRE